MPANSNSKQTEGNPAGNGRFLSWWIWAFYGVLILVGVPWYWPTDFKGTLFGLPIWTLCSLAASLVASLFTSWLLMTKWPLDDQDTETPSPEESRP